MAAKLRKGDRVSVLCGSDKGRMGLILEVDKKRGRALVDGINQVTKHVKPSGGEKGGRRQQPMPIDLSNLALVDPQSGRPTRVGFRIEDGKKTRFAKISGVAIDD